MSGFSNEIPHQLGKDTAIEKLQGFLGQVKRRYSQEISEMEGTWTDNKLNYEFTTFGIKVVGTLTVEEEVIIMDCNLPLAAMMFKGKISDSIKVELEKAIAA